MNRWMNALTTTADPALAACAGMWLALSSRLDRARADERGMTTETVIITAGLAALAVTVVMIIGSKVRSHANAIP